MKLRCEYYREVCHWLSEEELPQLLRGCELPIIVCSDRKLVICGLCSSLRYIVQTAAQCGKEQAVLNLLGLRHNCLRACAEVSEWTLYAEVTLPALVETVLSNSDAVGSDPATELLQLENQLAKLPAEPSRRGNRKQTTKDTGVDASHSEGNVTKDKCGSRDGIDQPREGLTSASLEDGRCEVMVKKFGSLQVAEIGGRHFVEGNIVQLTDLVVFVCIQLMFGGKDVAHWCSRLPRVVSWYQRMVLVPDIGNAVNSAGLFEYYSVADNVAKDNQSTLASSTESSSETTSKSAERSRHLLSMSTSGGCSLDSVHADTATDVQTCIQRTEKTKFHVSQALVDAGVAKATVAGLLLEPLPLGNGRCSQLPWERYPSWVLPCGVPDKRAARKLQQLENIAASVKEIVCATSTSSNGSQSSVIVDFCSGAGHVGILLAYLFPHCKVCYIHREFLSATCTSSTML